MSIGLSGKIYKILFLKTTIGSNNFTNLLTANWSSGNVEHQNSTWIYTKQNYFEILPEVRLLKDHWLFVNTGIGFSEINTTRSNGYYMRDADGFNDEDLFPRFDGRYQYFTFNIGANLHYKNIGIILEGGLRQSGFTKTTSERPGLGINQKSFKIGISYKLK